jgi:UDP-sugar transporter A1/2/3
VFGYENRFDLLNLCVPASLYAIQNNLIFYGIENLDPVNYKILSNIRILTTAGFAVLILGQKLSRQQWTMIFILCIGVVMVQHESSNT